MIGVKALAVIIRPADGALLVCESEDGSAYGYARPPGGSVEFGELAEEALRREMAEEFGQELTAVSALAVLENRFELDGSPGHEVDFVFRAEVPDPEFYRHGSIPVRDVPGMHAIWWTPATHGSRLVPRGLAAWLPSSLRAQP